MFRKVVVGPWLRCFMEDWAEVTAEGSDFLRIAAKVWKLPDVSSCCIFRVECLETMTR
jgi:hypothetical protein